MKRLQILVTKCENGYYIQIYKSFWTFWTFSVRRFVVKSKLEIGNIINDNWQEATEEEAIKDQIV